MQSVRQKDEFCLQTLRPATDEDLSNGPAVFKPWRVQLAERREAQMKQRLALPPPLLSLPLVAAESETSAIVVSKPSVDMAMVLRSVRQEAAEPPKIALTWREALAQRRRAALQSPRPALPAPARPLALPTSATPTVPTDNSWRRAFNGRQLTKSDGLLGVVVPVTPRAPAPPPEAVPRGGRNAADVVSTTIGQPQAGGVAEGVATVATANVAVKEAPAPADSPAPDIVPEPVAPPAAKATAVPAAVLAFAAGFAPTLAAEADAAFDEMVNELALLARAAVQAAQSATADEAAVGASVNLATGRLKASVVAAEAIFVASKSVTAATAAANAAMVVTPSAQAAATESRADELNGAWVPVPSDKDAPPARAAGAAGATVEVWCGAGI